MLLSLPTTGKSFVKVPAGTSDDLEQVAQTCGRFQANTPLLPRHVIARVETARNTNRRPLAQIAVELAGRPAT